MAKIEDSSPAAAQPAAPVPAPAAEVDYRPRDPKGYRPAIGLIGCGLISEQHLKAYRQAGYRVVALCDTVAERAEKRRRDFYPDAAVYGDWRELLDRHDIEVVDIATHPPARGPILAGAIDAGKHVLSQKPFVLDLDFGQELVARAERAGVRLAVNQNGRWAPHLSYIREAVRRGILGEVFAVHMSVHWDHHWICGTEFDEIPHAILYDFAIHWFDILTCFIEAAPRAVYASFARSPAQRAKPPLLAQASVRYERAQASLAFDADVRVGQQDRTFVAGTQGTASSVGPDLIHQELTLTTAAGSVRPALEGAWFPDGFHGTMGELLCAIEEGREPSNGARQNLQSLALCFAAVASAERGAPVRPGAVRTLAEAEGRGAATAETS